LIESKILGMCNMTDENGEDAKLICVPAMTQMEVSD